MRMEDGKRRERPEKNGGGEENRTKENRKPEPESYNNHIKVNYLNDKTSPNIWKYQQVDAA